VQDVETIVTCGADYSLTVAARSGGHSYASYCLGGVDSALVVDLSRMKNITIINGTAIVQTGNTLGDLATYLWENGQLALPHGK
jgi:FAD/FMN-containing dehydrogenase